MILENPQRLYKFGTVLLWLGVIIWAPYFVLRIVGESPSLMAFLPFHLVGVIGGERLRKTARKRMGIPLKKRKGYKRLAHWILIASILVWLPYYGLILAGRAVSLNPYLTVHLVGIFGGTGLMAAGGLVENWRNRTNGEYHGLGHPAQESD